jgi:uncharacterized protein YndB with AHSA1/START domain
MTRDPEGLTLHLERVLPSPRERVFAACVDPEQLGKWFGPAGFTVREADLDVRAGGRYRLTMRPPEGEEFHLGGRFSEVDPPRRLVYTFEYEEPDPDDQETLVTLTFFDHPGGAKVALEQKFFATEARYELHHTGWTETLDRLAAFLA